MRLLPSSIQPSSIRSPIPSAIVTLALLTACASDPVEQTIAEPSATSETTTPDSSVGDEEAVGPVLTYATTGGCAQMGPNCWTLVFDAGGRVDAYREPVEADEQPEATTTIDPALIDAYLAAMPDDVAGLVDGLAPGECRGCVDGVDTIVTLADGTVISSVDRDLDPELDLFAATDALALAAFADLDLPLETR